MHPSTRFCKALLLAMGLAWVAAAPAQTSPSGISSTSPGDGPLTGPSYSPGDAPATPLGSALGMGTGNIGSNAGDRTLGSSFSNDSIGNSGLGARSSGLDSGTGARSGAATNSGFGSSTGNGAGSGAASTAPITSSTQDYVDQAEQARCNGLSGAARGDCLDRLRQRMDMNSGVGARSAPGGRLNPDPVGIAPGAQVPRPLVGPTLPAPPR